MKSLSLCALASGALASIQQQETIQTGASIQAQTDASNANPIRKVVTMLQSMQKKVEAEGEKEKELYDKFMCYCKNAGSSLGASVSAAESKIPDVGANIDAGIAQKAQLEEDLKKAQVDRTAAKGAMGEATSLREKEAASFNAEATELKTNIAAMNKAITAVENGMAGQFLQTDGASILKKLALSSDSMLEADREELTSFLSGQEDDSDSYAPSSGGIVGILKEMEGTMAKSLAESTASETAAKDTYDQLMAAKTKEVGALTKAIEQKTVRVGQLGIEIVQMKDDLSDTEEALYEDKKFLAGLDENCATKEKEWAGIVKTRNEELLALADTIKILNDDDALELFKKTLPGSSAAFLQMGQKSLKKKALALLTHKPDKRLDFIVLYLKGKNAGFEKVIKMIDDMVALLKEEGVDDEHKKEYCTMQFDYTEDKKKELERSVSDLETAIEDAKEGIAQLKIDIEALDDGIKALDKSVAEATEQRKEENSDYTELLASNSAAKEILKFAKNRLNKFYNPKLYKAAASAAVLQISTHSHAFLQLSSHKNVADPGPPPEAPGAYKKKGEEGGGVIAMIDTIVADIDKEITESETAEKLAQEDYETLMADSAEKRALDSKTLTEKAGVKANTEAELAHKTGEHKSTLKELMATEEYIGALHAECDWLLKYFDMRKEARVGEIDSLNKAKAVLSGADFSLMQTNFLGRQ